MEMKDMIVIKNLPSNIVEEAWVIIKPEVKNKEKELIKRIKKRQKITGPLENMKSKKNQRQK